MLFKGENCLSTEEKKSKLFRLSGKTTKLVRLSLLIIIIVIIGSLVFLYVDKYLQNQETTRSASFTESIQKLAVLATAQAHTKTVIQQPSNKILGLNVPGFERTLFMVVPGDVTAGIDLKNFSKKDFTLDTKTKVIHISLPHAKIVQEPSIDHENVIMYQDTGMFRSDFKLEDSNPKFKQAQQQLKAESIHSGLLKKADDNAREILKTFFESQGYKATVTFK